MTEVLCVILGWFLSLLTIELRDFKNNKHRNLSLLNLLLSELEQTNTATIEECQVRLANNSPYKAPFLAMRNQWWLENKVLYMQHLPSETLLFDKWNNINEDIDLIEATKEARTSYGSLTKETKHNLELSIKYWQQSLYIILFRHLTNKQIR